MRLLRSRLFLSVVGVLVLAVALVGGRFALIMRDLAAVQRSFDGQLNLHVRRPAWMTYSVEKVVCDLFARKGSNAQRKAILDRCYILCGTPLSAIELNINSSKGDIGAALRRLSQLVGVSAYMTSRSTLGEAEATGICTALRTMPKLVQVGFVGSAFSDDAIAPLAGHPAIRSLGIVKTALTRRSIPTFASLPALETVYLPNREHMPIEEFTAVQQALPKVKVQ